MKDLRSLVGNIQKIVGAKLDYIYGPSTASAILQHLDSTFDIPRGLVARTRAIQNLVGTRVDGLFGPITAQVVLLALGKNGIEEAPVSPSQVGIFDNRTEKVLGTLDYKAQELFRKFTAKAKAVAAEMGYDVKAISGHRTWAQQDELYAQGRSKPGKIVTNARGGYSNHNFGVAVDYGVFKGSTYVDDSDSESANAVYRKMARHADSCNLEWGGNWANFPDHPHFEVRTGLTMAQKRARYKSFGTVL